MTSIVITAHAAQRYVERIDPSLSIAEVREKIRSHERAIVAAVMFGCRCVRLGNGAKLILDRESVVTVIARGYMGCGTEFPAELRL